MAFGYLLFDLGGVVFQVSFQKCFAVWSARTGLSVNEIHRRFTFDNTFDAFEKNSIAPEEYIRHVNTTLGTALSREDFLQGWNAIYGDVIDEMDTLLASLKARYRLVALTNTNALHAEVWPVKYKDVLVHFEHIFSSHVLGLRKPETNAFETVLNQLNCAPQEVLFLDDNEDYIKGAVDSGIVSIHVKNYTDMLHGMRKMGIPV